MREQTRSAWSRVPLAKLCTILSGGTPPKSELRLWVGDIPWVSGKDLKAPRLHDTIDHVSLDTIGAGTRLAPAGSVFLLVRGMGLAKDLPVALALRDMAFNQDVKALVPNDPRLGPYLRAAIYHRRHHLLSRIVPSAHGTLTLNLDDVERFEIPMPQDVDEAIAVAESLDLIQTIREGETVAATATASLKAAAMRALFTRGLRGEAQKDTQVGPIPLSWAVAPLEAHHSVVSGGTPSRSNLSYWQSGTIPWVKTTEVNYSTIRETEERITAEGLSSSAAKLLPPGTLLLAMYGQGVTRGRVALLGIEAACNQACAAIRPTDTVVNPKFLYHFLVSRYEEIRNLAHGGQQQNLNLELVRSLAIAIPSTTGEQDEIVTTLDAIDAKIDLHRRKRAVVEELFNALLHKLMTGEIRVADLDLSALSESPVPEVAA